VLVALLEHPDRRPIILTNSLGDKVRRHLATLSLPEALAVLGDTRQYDMDPDWTHRFLHPAWGSIQIWPVSEQYQVDLRRPIYYQALTRAAADGASLVVMADTFSLPGALPLLMGVPYLLLRTSYTPTWCVEVVDAHPLGYVIDSLVDLLPMLDALSVEEGS
jgi:hypothetical protein